MLGQHRATQRHQPLPRRDEAPLTAAIVQFATQSGRYGYRRITAWLRQDGWPVNAKRVERIWRVEGLKVPPRQLKRGRLWLTDVMGDPANYINFFHTASHRAAACCPRWAAA